MDSFIIIQGYLRNLWGSLPIIVTIAVVLLAVILLLILLALKQMKLWVQRTDTQIETLKSIDTKLIHLNTESAAIKSQPAVLNKKIKTKKLKENTEDKTDQKPQAGALKQEKRQTIPVEKAKPLEENLKSRITVALKKQSGPEKSTLIKRQSNNKGRSGKIYTIEELERQILD